MYLVGKIIGTHGINGEVKVKSESDFNRFKKGAILYVDEKEIKIDSVREHKGNILISFNNLQSINDVLCYVGKSIYTKHNHRDLNENEYFVEELVDLDVYTEEGAYVGVVKDVRILPHGHLLEVNNGDKIVLIPFVEAFIKEITKEKIIISVIEGLV